MPTPVPRIVKTLAHEKDPQNAKKTLRKIVGSKKTWTVLLMLALGGAGWFVARRYMTAARLSGIGKSTVDKLKTQGALLHIPRTPFNKRRVLELDALQKKVSTQFRNGNITSKVGADMMRNAFKPSDPEEIRKLYLEQFAAYANSVGSYNPVKHIRTLRKNGNIVHATAMYN